MFNSCSTVKTLNEDFPATTQLCIDKVPPPKPGDVRLYKLQRACLDQTQNTKKLTQKFILLESDA